MHPIVWQSEDRIKEEASQRHLKKKKKDWIFFSSRANLQEREQSHRGVFFILNTRSMDEGLHPFANTLEIQKTDPRREDGMRHAAVKKFNTLKPCTIRVVAF